MDIDYTMHGTDARTAERHVASDCLATSERPDSRAPPAEPERASQPGGMGGMGGIALAGAAQDTAEQAVSGWGEPPPLTSHV